MSFKKNVHKIQKIGHHDLISFAKGVGHQYMQYEVSMIICMGSIATQKKNSKMAVIYKLYQNH